MSQRNSEYARIPGDLYVTPRWVFDALCSVESFPCGWFDAAPVDADFDFLKVGNIAQSDIVTNPPFALAPEFVRHALTLTMTTLGRVAMLLPLEWDAAKGRADLFADCPAFKAQYVITRRIRWENLEQKAASPSKNHAWFVWDWKHQGRPIKGWLTGYQAPFAPFTSIGEASNAVIERLAKQIER